MFIMKKIVKVLISSVLAAALLFSTVTFALTFDFYVDPDDAIKNADKYASAFNVVQPKNTSAYDPYANPRSCPYWKQDGGGWFIQKPDGSRLKSSWVVDDYYASNTFHMCYLVDENGYMVTDPVLKDCDNFIHFVETNPAGGAGGKDLYGMFKCSEVVEKNGYKFYSGGPADYSLKKTTGVASVELPDGTYVFHSSPQFGNVNFEKDKARIVELAQQNFTVRDVSYIPTSNIVYTSSYRGTFGEPASSTLVREGKCNGKYQAQVGNTHNVGKRLVTMVCAYSEGDPTKPGHHDCFSMIYLPNEFGSEAYYFDIGDGINMKHNKGDGEERLLNDAYVQIIDSSTFVVHNMWWPTDEDIDHHEDVTYKKVSNEYGYIRASAFRNALYEDY